MCSSPQSSYGNACAQLPERMPPSNTSLTHKQFILLFSEAEHELMRYLMALLPNASDARDVLQETAVALWQTIEKYDQSQPFFPWACRFALNKVRQHLRTEARRNRVFDEDVAGLIADRLMESAPQLEKRREYLAACLAKLPEKRRKLVQEYYLGDHPIAEVARNHGLSVEAVYKALQRIRRTLMECINHKVRTEA